MTTREGGCSQGPWASLNLGASCGDDPAAVQANRARLAQWVQGPVVWPRQVHGAGVHRVGPNATGAPLPAADALWTTEPGQVLAVPVADCLPVLMSTLDGRAVAAVHAGWRGLAAGVLEAQLGAWKAELGCPADRICVWLGPCIGPRHFEVGPEVLDALGGPTATGSRFVARRRPDGQMRWLADLAGLARDRLQACGVSAVSGGAWCTFEDSARFFSFRREGVTGRMAGLVWIRPGLA